jgi:hypothetical protein
LYKYISSYVWLIMLFSLSARLMGMYCHHRARGKLSSI